MASLISICKNCGHEVSEKPYRLKKNAGEWGHSDVTYSWGIWQRCLEKGCHCERPEPSTEPKELKP